MNLAVFARRRADECIVARLRYPVLRHGVEYPESSRLGTQGYVTYCLASTGTRLRSQIWRKDRQLHAVTKCWPVGALTLTRAVGRAFMNARVGPHMWARSSCAR